MVRVKLQKGTAKGKAWKVSYTDPKTGRKRTIQGGQKGAKVKPKTAKAKSFRARHGEPETVKQYVNDRIWKGVKKGQLIRIPKKYI